MTDIKLHLVRHGESLANHADRSGNPRPADWDRLSERGWEQARELGRRLRGHGLELIVASTMVRAQETAQGIAEILELPVETDPDLHELRQSDAFYGSAPRFGETGSLNWMPSAPIDHAEPGAESFAAMTARVRRVRDRVEARAAQASSTVLVTHYGWLHFLLGLTLFGSEFAPSQIKPLWRAGHANTGISVFERKAVRVMDGIDYAGWGVTTWNDQAHL